MKNDISFILRFTITSISIMVAVALWIRGFAESPLLFPQKVGETKFLQNYLGSNKPSLQEERVLAESYWLRYKDVRNDPHWGKNGRMGVWGPRDHFKTFGKKEGRIYQPVIEPDDMVLEHALAEAYWQRYPEIRKSSIWGENSGLGILGPRDHYHYIGRKRGNVWGILE